MREQLAALTNLLGRLDGAAANRDPLVLSAVEAVARNPVVLEVQKQLIELEAKRDALASRYLDLHPRLIEVEEQVTAKRTQLTTAANQVVRGLHAERDKLAAQLVETEQHIAREEAELNRYQKALLSLTGLSERTHSLQGLYDQLLRRLGEESVASRLDRTEAVLVDPPRSPPRPVSWSLLAVLPLALLAGVAAGLAGAVGAHLLDPMLRGPAGLGRVTGLTLLGRLPGGAPAPPDPADPVRAEARRLRDTLLLRRPGGPCRIWLLAGSGGCGDAAVQLATALAAAGGHTLLVDADLRLPTLATSLGAVCERGLDGILAGEPNIAPMPSGTANLDLIGAAHPTANAAELLYSHCLPEWLAHLRSQYEHVVLAAPGLDAASDALLLAAHADGVLLAGRAGESAAQARSAAGLLRPLGDRLVGAVWIDAP